MNKAFKKVTSAALAAVLAFGMTVTGTAGLSGVQAADNKAFAAPVNFTGLNPQEDDWDKASTRLSIDIGDAEAFSDQYTFSYSVFIPKAALKEANAQVQVRTWLDFSREETYLGNSESRYLFLLVNDNDTVFPVVGDLMEQRDLEASEYKDFVKLSETGDFYKVTVKDAPVNSMMNVDGDGENQTAIDTSQGGFVSMETKITGLFNTLSSVVYMDDLSLKAGGTAVFETDFSAASMHGRHYGYMPGQEKDENFVERPLLEELNTSLLKLNKSSAAVKAGKTVKIKASAVLNGKITYKSSNIKVAAVTAKGVVKGVKAGKAVITVSANGVSRKFKVTVKK